MRLTTPVLLVLLILLALVAGTSLYVFDSDPQQASGQSLPASSEPPAPLSPADMTEVSGILILRGHLIRNPPTFQRTATTLLVNGLDVAPQPEALPSAEVPAPTPFETITRLAFSEYFTAVVAGGVDGLPIALEALLSLLQSSPHVSHVVHQDNYVIAYSLDGKEGGLVLATSQEDTNATAAALAVLGPDSEAQLASRSTRLDELHTRLESALKAGELVIWHGIDGGAVFPATEARALFHNIKQVMRDPNLDRAGRIRELIPLVRLPPLAEQIADNFTDAGL